jgi:hypothetical protein
MPKIIRTLAVVALVALSGGLWGSGRAQAAVAGKTYDLWASSGPGVSTPPAHTCVRFTATTIQVDACGPQAGPLAELPLLVVPPLPVVPPGAATTWSGIVPCQGVDLVLNGSALDGRVLGFQANVFSALAFSGTRRVAIGVHGVENPTCQ